MITNKSNLKRTAVIVLGILLGHFAMDIFENGVKDGKQHTSQTKAVQLPK